MLGLCLVVQIITGFVLSLHYTAHVNISFDSVIHVVRDVNNGWLFRAMHANGASLFLFVLISILDVGCTTVLINLA